MEVLCIDNKPGYNGHAALLRVGEKYIVSQSDHPDGYFVEGLLRHPITGREISFKKSRFIPISEIDETEMERNYNELLTTK